MEPKMHIPVMVKEVMDGMNLKPGQVIVDGTLGNAGHSLEMFKRILPGGRLIAIDRDQESLDSAKERLNDFRDSCEFVHGNFSDIDKILQGLGVSKVDGILLDLGISSFQLDNPERGFSFQNEGPLDMRLDRTSFISAYDLINNLNEDEISAILRNFGEERWHKRIARFIVQERQKHPIFSTGQLSEIINRATPYKYRYQRIHPATRTFQAVRIAVNRELEALEIFLNKAMNFLAKDARVCIISFHSLEDRIVKLNFRKFASEGLVRIITPKPLVTSEEEVLINPASRSAKLRVAERI